MCVLVSACLRGYRSFSPHAQPTLTPPPASKPNFTVLQRKTWHRSLHSTTWSHNSQSRTRKLKHFYTQEQQHKSGRGKEQKNKQSQMCTLLTNGVLSYQSSFCFMFLVMFNCLPLLCFFFVVSAMSSSPSFCLLPLPSTLLNSSLRQISQPCSWGSVAYTQCLPAVYFMRHTSPNHRLKVGDRS